MWDVIIITWTFLVLCGTPGVDLCSPESETVDDIETCAVSCLA